MIPYEHQDIDQLDIDAVVKVLRSDLLAQGPATPGSRSIQIEPVIALSLYSVLTDESQDKVLIAMNKALSSE